MGCKNTYFMKTPKKTLTKNIKLENTFNGKINRQ